MPPFASIHLLFSCVWPFAFCFQWREHITQKLLPLPNVAMHSDSGISVAVPPLFTGLAVVSCCGFWLCCCCVISCRSSWFCGGRSNSRSCPAPASASPAGLLEGKTDDMSRQIRQNLRQQRARESAKKARERMHVPAALFFVECHAAPDLRPAPVRLPPRRSLS